MKPYLKAQTLPLEGLLDRRRRLTDAQKDEVRKLHSEGWSQRKLARAFGCSRTLVQLLVNPERAKAVADRFKANWRKYANARGKAYAASAVKSWRNYKYGLLKKGVLHDPDSAETYPQVGRCQQGGPVQGALQRGGHRHAGARKACLARRGEGDGDVPSLD